MASLDLLTAGRIRNVDDESCWARLSNFDGLMHRRLLPLFSRDHGAGVIAHSPNHSTILVPLVGFGSAASFSWWAGGEAGWLLLDAQNWSIDSLISQMGDVAHNP